MARYFIDAFGKPRELIAHRFATRLHILTLPTDGMVLDRPCEGADTILVFGDWTVILPTVRGEIPAAVAPDERIGPRSIFSGRRAMTIAFRDGMRTDLPVWLIPHDEQRMRSVKAIQALLASPGSVGEPRRVVTVNGQKEPVFCSWASSLGSGAVLYCIETHERRYSVAVATTGEMVSHRLEEIRTDGQITFANGQPRTMNPRGKPLVEELPTDLQALRARQWQLERRRVAPAGRHSF